MKGGVVLSVKTYLRRKKTDKPRDVGKNCRNRNKNYNDVQRNKTKTWRNCKFTKHLPKKN